MPRLTRRAALAGAATLPLIRRARAQTPPIRIGVLTDMNGPYSEDVGQGSVVATELAIADFAKDHPEIRVELISADAGIKPDTYVSLAGAWYDREGVDVIIDVPASAAALAMVGLVAQKNKVALLTGPGTSDLTGKACGPNHIHWTYDSYALATSTARAIVAQGGDSWFFIQADYALGNSLAGDAAGIVTGLGGTVKGVAKHPFPGTTDFSSYLLQAQASGAKVVGLANAGVDAGNTIKQAHEFGLTRNGTKLAALLCQIPQFNAIGLQAGQGLLLTESFYWDRTDGTRAFSARFAPRMNGAKPCMTQAGPYSATLHYLKAVAAMGVPEAKANGAAVVAKMKSIPTDDPLFGPGEIRADGRKTHDVYLFEVKSPEQSKYPWDYYRLLQTIPAAQAWRPPAAGGCAMVKA